MLVTKLYRHQFFQVFAGIWHHYAPSYRIREGISVDQEQQLPRADFLLGLLVAVFKLFRKIF
jgi:sugar phosphate permease